MSAQPKLVVTSDFTDDFTQVIKRFRGDAVLVGIPEGETDRSDDNAVNNATLLAINNFGSPANNIPKRPVMELGIKKAKDQIAEEFKNAARSALSAGVAALTVYYNRAGIIASNSIKKVINSQEGFKPPSEATLAIRESRGFKGTKALVVTGQMRNAITYVVKEKV